MKRLFVYLLLLTLVFTGSALAQDAPPAFDDLETGVWTQIDGGEGTICSQGTPFSFYVRPAESPSDKLLIHFQGGGACWFGANCDLSASPTYDPLIDESDDPTNYGGIFNFEHEDNPFSDYNMVMVPYCTADVHLGDAETTYTVGEGDDANEVTIYHNGYDNAMAVLNWTFENIMGPDTVFVTGCSAGAIPSPFYTPMVAEAYPDARVEQFGDAAGGYRSDARSMLWNAWETLDILPEAYADYTVETLSFESFYMESASAYPEVSFTQFNSSADQTQVFFLSLIGVTNTPLLGLLEANYADIEAADADNFSAYTSWGDVHCITPSDAFYDYQVNGVRLADWVAELAAGEEVESVTCDDCETEEFYEEE